jgi:hypothetical protein
MKWGAAIAERDLCVWTCTGLVTEMSFGDPVSTVYTIMYNLKMHFRSLDFNLHEPVTQYIGRSHSREVCASDVPQSVCFSVSRSVGHSIILSPVSRYSDIRIVDGTAVAQSISFPVPVATQLCQFTSCITQQFCQLFCMGAKCGLLFWGKTPICKI